MGQPCDNSRLIMQQCLSGPDRSPANAQLFCSCSHWRSLEAVGCFWTRRGRLNITARTSGRRTNKGYGGVSGQVLVSIAARNYPKAFRFIMLVGDLAVSGFKEAFRGASGQSIDHSSRWPIFRQPGAGTPRCSIRRSYFHPHKAIQ